MMSSRAKRFFGDIVSEELVEKNEKMVCIVDYDLINEVMWDAFNGRGKRASKPVKKFELADDYYLHPEDDYVNWDEEIEKVLAEVK